SVPAAERQDVVPPVGAWQQWGDLIDETLPVTRLTRTDRCASPNAGETPSPREPREPARAWLRAAARGREEAAPKSTPATRWRTERGAGRPRTAQARPCPTRRMAASDSQRAAPRPDAYSQLPRLSVALVPRSFDLTPQRHNKPLQADRALAPHFVLRSGPCR